MKIHEEKIICHFVFKLRSDHVNQRGDALVVSYSEIISSSVVKIE